MDKRGLDPECSGSPQAALERFCRMCILERSYCCLGGGGGRGVREKRAGEVEGRVGYERGSERSGGGRVMGRVGEG